MRARSSRITTATSTCWLLQCESGRTLSRESGLIRIYACGDAVLTPVCSQELVRRRCAYASLSTLPHAETRWTRSRGEQRWTPTAAEGSTSANGQQLFEGAGCRIGRYTRPRSPAAALQFPCSSLAVPLQFSAFLRGSPRSPRGARSAPSEFTPNQTDAHAARLRC